MVKKAVIILSGGLDSTTCMGIAKEQGYELYPLTFHYGQRHDREVEQAKKVACYYEVHEHKVVQLDFLQQIGGSSLTDQALDVPGKDKLDFEAEDIPNTYVPARNLNFLSLATAYAETIGAESIFIGVSAIDYSGYPDCRPEFIESMQQTVNLATKAGAKEQPFTIQAPLIRLSKAETIREGMRLQVPYHLTTSCYLGQEQACGECDSCRLRLEGFKAAGFEDPIFYRY